MKYITESEMYINALHKCRLNKSVAPLVRGIIVEDTDTYNKVQTLLDCPEMEASHPFLYDLDLEDVAEEDADKVNKLYDLAVEKGFVSNDEREDVDEDEWTDDTLATDQFGEEPTPEITSEPIVPTDTDTNLAVDPVAEPLPSNSYTCLYSAMKGGKITTGECYTNALDPEGAKAEAIVKLTALGLTAIDILATETGNPAMKGAETPFKVLDAPVDTDMRVDDQTLGTDISTNAFESKKLKNHKKIVKEADDTEEDEESEEANDPEEEPKEIPDQEKSKLKAKLIISVKEVLSDMHIESCEDMNMEEYGDFWLKLYKKWGANRPDIKEFMTDDEIDDINNIRVKKTK